MTSVLASASTPPGGPSHREGVVLAGVSKQYGGNTVVDDVTVAFAPGSVHGLVGENGAGKSTLVKMLTGVTRPTTGHIDVDGRAVQFRDPAAALTSGLSLISQELALVPSRSVLDNVFLGAWSTRAGFTRSRVDESRCRQLMAEVGFELDPDALVRTLTVAAQQQVEILRAVARNSRLIVMDEPTAVLTTTETVALLALIRRLAEGGTTVILVSHFLEEILEVCDTVTVLRDGRHILTEPAQRHSPQSLINAMAGRSVDILFPERPAVSSIGERLLEVSGLTRYPMVRAVDLHVCRGEIVGLAGLVGSGRSEVARLIFGADRADSGSITMNGRLFQPRHPQDAMHAGVGMVPESRKEQGLHLARSLGWNTTLASLRRLSRHGLRNPPAERRLATEATQGLDIRGVSLTGPVWTLSGGNQQKVLFAKWIARKPDVLIVDEPTRGVDVRAKVQIHRLIRELADAGTAILLISSEVEEVIGLTDRIYVMRQGMVSAEFAASTVSPSQVLAAAFDDKERHHDEH